MEAKDIKKIQDELQQNEPKFNGGECKVDCNCIEIAEHEALMRGEGGVKSYPCLGGSKEDVLSSFTPPTTKQSAEDELTPESIAEYFKERVGLTDYQCEQLRFDIKSYASNVSKGVLTEEESKEKCVKERSNISGSSVYHDGFEDGWYLYDKWMRDRLSNGTVKESRWISVEDRLPEKDGRYHVYDGDNVITWSFRDNEFGNKYITHWQPLPSPPNQKK